MTRRSRLALLLLVVAALAGCTRVYYDRSQSSSTATATPTAPTPTPAVVTDVIEYRIFGTVGASIVTIKYTNSIDGLTVLSTASLPYVASIRSTDAAVFLYCEASAQSLLPTAVLQAQIYVNGKLFREAFSSGVGPLSSIASGTYRR